MTRLKVAGRTIRLDIPDRFVEEHMRKFMCPPGRGISDGDDIIIEATHGQAPEIPEGAVKEVDFTVHNIYNYGEHKYYVRSADDYVTCLKYDKGCTCFTLYLNDLIADDGLDEIGDNAIDMNFSSVLRRIFVMIIAKRGGVNLHSASILHNGGAIIFSAPSGTGKTTHVGMWGETFPGTEVINGDNGYCFADNGGAFICGAPWCGTSGDCLNIKAPIRAIVFLEQAKENIIRELDIPEAFIRLSAGCFLPAWDKDLMTQAIGVTEKLASDVKCYHLKCLPDHSAARTAYEGIYRPGAENPSGSMV